QPEILEHHSHAPAQHGNLLPVEARDIASKQAEGAPGWANSQVKQLEQGGFSGAAGADQEMKRSGSQRKGQVPEYFRPAAIAQADALESHQGFDLWPSTGQREYLLQGKMA